MTEEEKPLTREDVVKLIEEHGGPEGLDLSGRNLDGIDLSKLNLAGIDLHSATLTNANFGATILAGANLVMANLIAANFVGANLFSVKMQQADLFEANLQEAHLHRANLQQADLRDASLEGATLHEANLQGANLRNAKLQGAYLSNTKLCKAKLYRVEISRETRLENVDWGPKYILGEEEAGHFRDAEDVYRMLKQWHTQAGIQDIAGEFSFREMEARRKALKWWPNPLPRAWLTFLAALFGYGERPLNLTVWAAVVILGFAGIYSTSALSFLDSLYYSASSFTALGYGAWASHVEGYVKGLGALEAFVGILMIVFFSVTSTRKLAR